MKAAPIFLIASERSGTNLLRKRFLESQTTFFAPSPAHFLDSLYYREPYYANDRKGKTELVEDAIKLTEIHFSPWDIKFSANEVIQEIEESGVTLNSINLMHYLYLKYSEKSGFESYFCKDICTYEFWLAIKSNIPTAKFIYLHRDPRDFVLSQIKRPQSTMSVYEAASTWAYEQTKAIRAFSALGESALKISYEDLITNEDYTIKKVLEFTGANQSDSAKSLKLFDEVHEWKNLNQETIKDNSGKFKTSMSQNNISLIEGLCWLQMKKLNYQTIATTKPLIGTKKRFTSKLKSIPSRIRKQYRNRTELSEPVIKRAELLSKLKVNYRNITG